MSIDNVHSEPCFISCGVPQGSILGPLLFLIFINDLPLTSNFKFNLFADDTTLQWSSDNLQNLENDVDIELKNISKWFSDNHLTLNESKTKYIIFNHRNPVSINIALNDIPVQQCGRNCQEKSVKFLGILLDDRLNWSIHVDFVCKKIRKLLYTIIRLKNFLQKAHKVKIYSAIIKPHLEYGLTIWGKSIPSKVDRIQKKCIRIITLSKPLTHSLPLFKSLGILNLADLYKLNVLALIWRIFNKKCPETVVQNFHVIRSSTNRQHKNTLYVPFARSNFYQRLPSYHFPSLWNNSLPMINSIYHKRNFKKQVKLALLNSYSEICPIGLPACYVCSKSKILLSN